MNPYRLGIQWIIAGLLLYLIIRPLVDKTYASDFEAYCPFGGLQAISSFLVNNSLACSMTTTQIFIGFALVLAIILVSKLFCSFVCPIGSLTEWLGRLGSKMKWNFQITGIADQLLRVIKYSLLFVTFYFSITSSELFCKTFDPYYAIFSGFSNDVVISYAVAALFLAIPGSLFVRQFWCKYICPLGAVSNIFSYSYLFIGLTAVYFFLTMVLNIQISWIWLLAVLTVVGFLLEFFKVKTYGLSVFKVTRNSDSCTSCNLCNKACPMNIKVSKLDQVKNIDCHLCGDCVASCPEKNTLHLTRKPIQLKSEKQSRLLWLPAAVIVLLVLVAMAFAERVHIPTISMKWGDELQMQQAGVYEQSGLTSIKCFGSSMSFANHMKELNGVLGVETYVSDHSVKVMYDKNVITEDDIKKAVFTPVKRIVSVPLPNTKKISIAEAAIDQFFDPNDAHLLSLRFKQNKGILAMQTQFGEPVHTIIYFDEQVITLNDIKELIESKIVEWNIDGEKFAARTNFKASSIAQKPNISLEEYLMLMYDSVSMEFNNYATYDTNNLRTFIVPFPQAADPELIDMPWYLLSHVSNDKGIVSFKISPSNEGFMLEITFVVDMTDETKIKNLLSAETLSVHLSDGSLQSLDNPYKFW